MYKIWGIIRRNFENFRIDIIGKIWGIIWPALAIGESSASALECNCWSRQSGLCSLIPSSTISQEHTIYHRNKTQQFSKNCFSKRSRQTMMKSLIIIHEQGMFLREFNNKRLCLKQSLPTLMIILKDCPCSSNFSNSNFKHGFDCTIQNKVKSTFYYNFSNACLKLPR